MKFMKKTTIMAVAMLAAFTLIAGIASAQTARTLTVGTASGQVGTDVLLPITVNDPSGIGGVAFTMTYDPAVFEFKGLEKATTGPVIDGSGNAGATVTATTLFFQSNDVKQTGGASVGRVMVAGAAADPLTATTLFNAKFGIKAGAIAATYPIGLQRSIINNPAAGYSTDTFIPVLVGTGTKTAGKYTTTEFPVIPATLVAGGITVTAPTFSLGGKVTYGSSTGAFAAGCAVVLKRVTTSGDVWNDQTTVGANGLYNFTGKQAGSYKISVTSLDPNFNDFESSAIAISTANVTNADAVLTAKPQPVRVTGTVTNYVPGMLAQVIDSANNVVGTYAVGADGKFTSPLLSPGTYRWKLLYGSLVSDPLDNGATANFDKSVLKSISGNISGLPTGGGAITASSATGKITKTLQVTANGAYTIGDLVAADDYIVSAVAPGLPLTYYDGKTDVNAATKVNIATNNATDINFNFTPPAQYIKGWIKDSGAGVSGITVYAFEVNTFALISARTDTGGNYSISVPKGTFEVFVIKANGKIFYFLNENGTPTQVEANATLRTVTTDNQEILNTNIDITECDKTLTGRVTLRTLGGDPVSNALITASTANQRALGLTGQDGRYSVGGLCNGVSYAVEMKPLTGNYPVQTTSIVGGTDTTKNFIIDTGAVLSGRVTEQGSSPAKNVSGAMIYLKDKATGALVGGRIYFSATDGQYSVRDIQSGEYTLEVTHPDYRSTSVDLVIGADLTQNVELVKGAHFKGNVTGSGRSLAGATIIVTRAGEAAIYTVTNSAGFYSVYGLDATKSDYVIIAQARGFERQAKTSQTPSTAGTTADFALVPPAATYTVSGLVKTDVATNPEIAGAIVLVSSASKNFFASTTTALNGTYSVENLLPATDYRITVIPPGSLPTQSRGFTVTNAPVTQDFTIALGKNIGGTVTGSEAIPTGTKIYVFLYKGDAYQGYVIAGTGGSFLFKGLADGSDYKVLAVASGYTSGWFNGKATIGTADAITTPKTDVNITLTKK